MSRRPERVLFVDDEPRLLAGITRRLSQRFNILTANSGLEAIQLVEKHDDIAVIVADMQMPEMNGIQLLKKFKTISPHTRRIMLTGNSDEQTIIAAVNDGEVMRFLRKPCEADILTKAITHALDDFHFAMSDSGEELQIDSTTAPANMARNAFLSTMTHELRTPLHQIIGLADVLEKERPLSDASSSEGFPSRIKTSAADLLILVNRILEYARLQSQLAHSEPEPFDLCAGIQEEIDTHKQSLLEKRITVSFEFSQAPVNVEVRGGEAMLAFRELFSNAIKFNRQDGHISVIIKCTDNSASVRVSDTGCGMADNVVHHAQEPFRQIDDSLSRTHDGVGLGLALVSSVAILNGGDIKIESTEQIGTTIVLTFPRPADFEQKQFQAMCR